MGVYSLNPTKYVHHSIWYLTQDSLKLWRYHVPLTLPPTEKALDSGEDIPSWIKQTVGFWVDGHTTDVEFINAIQYLVKQGVIVLS